MTGSSELVSVSISFKLFSHYWRSSLISTNAISFFSAYLKGYGWIARPLVRFFSLLLPHWRWILTRSPWTVETSIFIYNQKSILKHYHASIHSPSSSYASWFAPFSISRYLCFYHFFYSLSSYCYQFLSLTSATPTGSLFVGYFSAFFFILLFGLGICRIHYGTEHPDVFSKSARDLTMGLSSSVKKVIAVPVRSALPVRPTRWI